MSKEYQHEKVTFTASPLNNGEFIPRITVGDDNHREFQKEDMERVLDYEQAGPHPADAPHGHLEFEMDENETVRDDAPPKFPKRFFCLRGSYIFYYDTRAVDTNYDSMAYDRFTQGEKFKDKPIGVIPLERCVVEFPPGGRRVFREHAMTEARTGYELMIRHVVRTTHKEKEAGGSTATGGTEKVKRRAPAYLVMDSLGQRDAWAEAIRTRADLFKKDTKLRAAGKAPDESASGAVSVASSFTSVPDDGVSKASSATGRKGPSSILSPNRRVGGEISVLAGVIESEEQAQINDSLKMFGTKTLFDEESWVNDFFKNNTEAQGVDMCLKLEKWQTSIKKGLRGAVLEQYEYFVEASKEMTIMGREISSLKELVTSQMETFDSMKRINFDLDFDSPNGDNALDGGDHSNGDEKSTYSSDEDESGSRTELQLGTKKGIFSGLRKGATSPVSAKSKKSTSTIDIPEWLDDVVEEITAFFKECRYTDTTELLLKAKSEVSDIISLNEKLTEKKLSRKELASMRRILIAIEDISKRLADRLSEGLRRKNEALKQTIKREKADPLSGMIPSISPVALNDDSTALNLLVRLGRPQEAASAYATRRSLLLQECLQERPICDSDAKNNMDIVIYAAQLSHSFFHALSMSVEGFLDLFTEKSSGDDQSESSSIHTGTNLSNIPSNALAAICLWCDTELLKFAAVFGSRILSNLTLSPRPTGVSNKISDKINKLETTADITNLKEQLRIAEEMGEYAAAGKLRKKIAIIEEDEKNGESRTQSTKTANDKERQTALEIAAKCIDQAFLFSSESLNTIGLPLSPRLAEYLRTRLKGAEADVAVELEDSWNHIIFNWKSNLQSDINIVH